MRPNTSVFELEPPRSTDHNPLDFYLLGHLKSQVYLIRFENEERLHQKHIWYCRTIHNCPGTFESVGQFMIRCVHVCISAHGHI